VSLCRCKQTTLDVLAAVAGERIRQDERWGVQDHPMIAREVEDAGAYTRAEFYGVRPEHFARATCERRFANGIGSFVDILAEEVSEAICAQDDSARRAELIQVAAVAVAMVEAIDRRTSRALDSVSMDAPA